MELKQLEYFIHVAESASFTRASIELDVAQPALSRQVRLLEIELQQHLFIRNGRGVTMTDAGKLLLEHGRGILHQVARTREELSRTSGTLVGRVALGIPPSLMKSLAVPLTRAFRQQLPYASLTISEGLSVTMQESLASGRLDIALLYNIAPSPDIETTPLIDEEMFLIEPMVQTGSSSKGKSSKSTTKATDTVTLKELADVPLIVPCRPNSIRMLIESEMAHIGYRPKIALEIDSVSAILALVGDGQGSAILTRNAANSLGDTALFHIRKITSPALKSKLMLATCIRHPTTLVQQKFIALIQQEIGVWLGSD